MDDMTNNFMDIFSDKNDENINTSNVITEEETKKEYTSDISILKNYSEE